MRVILASGSPRRKELLKLVVPEFEVIVSKVDEKIDEQLLPQEVVQELAYQKAKDVFDRTDGNRVVIGSDTIVTKNKKIFGKPHDRENAKQMIKELLQDDKTHSVITGLCVISQIDGVYKEYKTYDEVKVLFKDISDEEIDRWIDTGKAMDKAGAYAVQEEFCRHIEKIEGNFHTVVGLPTHKLYDILKELECI